MDGEKAKLRFMQKYWHKGAYFQVMEALLSPATLRCPHFGPAFFLCPLPPHSLSPPLPPSLCLQDNADDERSSAGGYDIYQRDYSGPTGEDKFDRAALPKVMQVRDDGGGEGGRGREANQGGKLLCTNVETCLCPNALLCLAISSFSY